MDDDIEEMETILAKEQIETEKAYDDCSVILKEFDKNNSQFSNDVYNLLNIYADAVKNVIISNCIIDSHYSQSFYYFPFSFLARQSNIMVANAHRFIY